MLQRRASDETLWFLAYVLHASDGVKMEFLNAYLQLYKLKGQSKVYLSRVEAVTVHPDALLCRKLVSVNGQSKAIICDLLLNGYDPIVPPKSNRLRKWHYDKELFKRRNEIERFFRRLKRFRRIFTRYIGCCVFRVYFVHNDYRFSCVNTPYKFFSARFARLQTRYKMLIITLFTKDYFSS